MEAEAEQVIAGCGGRDLAGSLGGEQLGKCAPGGRIVNGLSTAGAVEGVLVVLARKRMQRIPAVPVQIGLLGPGHDKGVQAAIMDERAHRVHPRPAIAADRGQERKSDSELVQQRPARIGQARLGPLELTPCGSHGPQSPQDRISRQRATVGPRRPRQRIWVQTRHVHRGARSVTRAHKYPAEPPHKTPQLPHAARSVVGVE